MLECADRNVDAARREHWVQSPFEKTGGGAEGRSESVGLDPPSYREREVEMKTEKTIIIKITITITIKTKTVMEDL